MPWTFFPVLLLGFGGTQPISKEIELGSKIAKQRKGPERLTRESRKVIGTWFDGSRKRDVEELVSLSPALLSRWIGYLGLAPEESKNVWSRFWDQMLGKHVAMIRLARLDSVDWHDGDTRPSGNPEALEKVKFYVNSGGLEWVSVTATRIQDLQDRSPQLVLRDEWFEVLSGIVAWPGSPSKFPLVSEIRWGKNRLCTYIVEMPESIIDGRESTLKIVETDRTRLIKFRFR
jgi:hypothetical protein